MGLPILATADVSDVTDGDIAMDVRIRPMWKGAQLLGPAYTVRTPAGQHPAVRRALESAAPGDVIVIDGAADSTRALWGERMALRAQERGIAGVVVDGAVRDVAAIEELGFAAFALTSVPTAPRTELDGEVGVSIECGDQKVEPRDLIVGDGDGVVVVPRVLVDDVLRRLTTSRASP